MGMVRIQSIQGDTAPPTGPHLPKSSTNWEPSIQSYEHTWAVIIQPSTVVLEN